MSLQAFKKEMQNKANPSKATVLARFFKTGKGQYGEGDVFLGIIVPEQRKIARNYEYLHLSDIDELLNSPIHELRLTALFILIRQYEKGDDIKKREIYNFFITHLDHVNNWDLVDLSAPKIVGDFMLRNPEERTLLKKWVTSKNLWERRIAMLSTYTFIKKNQFDDALFVAEKLLYDSHDLIQKAVGWMLREIGKIDLNTEEQFLRKYYTTMPRTALRYAIERLDAEKRELYMKK